ncbi:MAG: histidinol-phosphatase HisJ family protein [Butyrivibrio sp.]|nr:histidinol-phosphatase HisJ family protein [Butyrivibrio sp.]
MITADYHMHTHHSGDSTAPMEDMIESSIEKGLDEICFTEHLDLDFPDIYDLPPEPFTPDLDAYRDEVMHCRTLYKEKIAVRHGIEIGLQPQVASENKAVVKKYGFDFIIASEHLVDKEDPYYPSFWEKDDHDKIYNRFFEQTYDNLCLFDDYDVLGHLDYINRYEPGNTNTYSYKRYSAQIDRILKHLIAHDKGLDVNGKVLFSNPSGMPNPHPDVLGRYKDLGGKLITFGSDAHAPQSIASGFERMRDIALSLGFTEYFTFKNRTPIPHRL